MECVESVSQMCVQLGSLPLETLKSLPLIQEGWGLIDRLWWEPSHVTTGTKHLTAEMRGALQWPEEGADFFPRQFFPEMLPGCSSPSPSISEKYSQYGISTQTSIVHEVYVKNTLLGIHRTFRTREQFRAGKCHSTPLPMEFPA